MSNATMAAIRLTELPNKKSMAAAIILTVLFGWLGTLYAKWQWALIGFACSCVVIAALPQEPGVIVISWIASMATSFAAVRQRNDKIEEQRRILFAAMEEKE